MVQSVEYPINARVWLRTSNGEPEWVVELEGSINDTSFITRHPVPATYAPEDAVGLPHLYPALPAKLGNTPLGDVLDACQGMLDEMGLHDSQVMAGKLRELMAILGHKPMNSLFRPRDAR